MSNWETYLKTNQTVILSWIQRFAPTQLETLKNLLEVAPLDCRQIYNKLNDAWFAAPDQAQIRTEGFFKLCNLLDGTVPAPWEEGEEDES